MRVRGHGHNGVVRIGDECAQRVRAGIAAQIVENDDKTKQKRAKMMTGVPQRGPKSMKVLQSAPKVARVSIFR